VEAVCQGVVRPFTGRAALWFGGRSFTAGNEDPKYGNGGAAYAKRYGAAMADFTTQNLFSAAVLASVLHQDPGTIAWVLEGACSIAQDIRSRS